MLKYGNKEFLNLEEQVAKNQADIERIQTGVKIDRWVAEISDLAQFMTEENVGKYYLVGSTNPQTLYVLTKRANGGLVMDSLGDYPKAEKGDQGIPGPRGEKGETGERGPQGIKGNDGAIGKTGSGWNSITELTTEPYTPTFTIQDDDVLVSSSIDIITNKDTPDEETHTADFKFEIPKASAPGIQEINGKTGSSVTLNSDDISDTNCDHKFATQAQLTQIETNVSNIMTLGYTKQDSTDQSLSTVQKTVVGAINEVNAGLAGKQDTLTFDNTPTQNSNNPVKSGGVYSAIQNVREVAEGKSKAYCISYKATVNPSQYGFYSDINGNTFSSQAALEAYISGLECMNNDFNSQSASIDLYSQNISSKYLLIGTYMYKTIVIDEQLSYYFKTGDVIYVVETNVPDRWINYDAIGVLPVSAYKLETTKVVLDDYQTKTDSNLQTTSDSVVGAINELNTNKVSKLSPSSNTTEVYVAANNSGTITQSGIQVDYSPYAGRIPTWDSNSNLRTNTPVNSTDCANKSYVDSKVKAMWTDTQPTVAQVNSGIVLDIYLLVTIDGTQIQTHIPAKRNWAPSPSSDFDGFNYIITQYASNKLITAKAWIGTSGYTSRVDTASVVTFTSGQAPTINNNPTITLGDVQFLELQ